MQKNMPFFKFSFRIVVRSVQQTVYPDEIMRAQQMEKEERERLLESDGESRTETPDSGYDNRRDTAFDNKALDMKDEASANVEESDLPEVGYKNGKPRHRQNSNQTVAETNT